MKKLLISLFVIAGFAVAASAQTFKAGDSVLGVNVGFKGLKDTSYGVSYEYSVADNLFGVEALSLGLGINGLFCGYTEEVEALGIKYSYEHGDYIYTGRVALHASLLDGLDVYLAGNLGGSTLTTKETLAGGGAKIENEEEGDTVFVYSGVLGARYFFVDTFGIGVEGCVGNSQSLIQASLLFKF